MTEISSSKNAQQQWGTIESNISQRITGVPKFEEMPMEGHETFLKNKAKQAAYSKKGLIRIVDDERSISVLGQDPIGSHLIKLRKYALTLENLIFKASKLKNERGRYPLEVKKLEPVPPIPPFPEKYPFVGSLEKLTKDSDKQILTYKIYPTKKVVDNQIKHFVGEVLQQTGYHVREAATLHHLSDCVQECLGNIARILRHYKNSPAFTDSEDLMRPLEVTLRAIGYGGIKGVHNFYYHDFIKKHDIMLKQCVTLHNEYEKLLEELKIAQRNSEESRNTGSEEEIMNEESMSDDSSEDME